MVLSGQPLPCSPDAFIPVFEVRFLAAGPNASSCLGVAALQQPALSLNDTVTLITSVPAGPVSVFAPAACVPYSPPPADSACSWNNANLAYPTYAPVFVLPASAQADAAYWLGIWIAFLLLFVIAVPVVVYGMVVNCKEPAIQAV